MEQRVRAKVGCTDIDVVDNRCPSRGEAELPEEIRYPTELGSRGSDRSVFYIGGGPSNYTLFHRTSRYGIATETDDEGAGGCKIIPVARPIMVRVGT